MKITRTNAILLACALGFTAGCTNPEVPAGHEGYVFYKPLIFSKMEYRKTLRGPASTGVSWRLYTINIDMRARSFNEHFQLLTRDNLTVSFEVNTRIKPKDGEVKQIVEDWGGEQWYEWNVKEPLRTIVRETVTDFSAIEIQLDTPKVKAGIEAKLTEKHKDAPFAILSVDIGEIKFPAKVAEAIEMKLATAEELKRQKFVKEKTEKEAAIRVLEALRVAEQQSIISETLDPLYVQRRAVEVYKKLGASKNKTVIVLPNSADGTGMPLVMSKGRRKVLSANDRKLLDRLKTKYMKQSGKRIDMDALVPGVVPPEGEEPHDGAAEPAPAPAPEKPAPAKPAPAGNP
jgi:regulator of protease activity HflC (stomatin/prohibitin superfamily)